MPTRLIHWTWWSEEEPEMSEADRSLVAEDRAKVLRRNAQRRLQL